MQYDKNRISNGEDGLCNEGFSDNWADTWGKNRDLSLTHVLHKINSKQIKDLKRKIPCSCSVTSNSLRSHGLQPASLLCSWNSPGKNTGVGSYSLLHGIFPIQESNLSLLHCRQVLYHLSHEGSPKSRVTMHSCLRAHLISLPGEH